MTIQSSQRTILYSTYIKETIVAAAIECFAMHPDPDLPSVKVSVNLPLDKVSFPSVVVKFYERDIHNLGVDHHEWLEVVEDGIRTGTFVRHEHYGYYGDVEFAIYALSSPDRDIVGDSIVQMLTMPHVQSWTMPFYNRFYQANFADPTSFDFDPNAENHFINLNKDRIMGYGEAEVTPAWAPEDQILYQKSYRISLVGEYYSPTPTVGPFGTVREVDVYPYDPDIGEPKPNPDPLNPNPWFGSGEEFF